MNSIRDTFNSFNTFVSESPQVQSCASKVGDFFKTVGNEVSRRADALKQYIPTVDKESVAAGLQKMKSVGCDIVDTIAPTVRKGAEVAKSLGTTAVELAKPVAEAIIETARPVAQKVAETMAPLAEKVAEIVSPVVQKVTSAVKSTFADLLVACLPGFSEIFNAIKVKAQKFASDFAPKLSDMMDKAKSFAVNIFEFLADLFRKLIANISCPAKN